ncbi:hypothetical protein [Sphaerothrix gracilis]|uniref:hypothetical protein n=1 Tax=Sphaerothrix gracilis TaxID=3151835 RepID=UPI0031FC063F
MHGDTHRLRRKIFEHYVFTRKENHLESAADETTDLGVSNSESDSSRHGTPTSDD